MAFTHSRIRTCAPRSPPLTLEGLSMDTARDKRTMEPVEAEELWVINPVDKDGYICRGCEIQVFPASFDRQHNKKRPYFTLGPSNKHLSGCDVDGYEQVSEKAKKERLGGPEGFPLPFPNKITLSDDRVVVPDEAIAQTEGAPERTQSRAKNAGANERYHGHTVKTIRSICRTFIQFTHDRSYLPLSIPGVSGDRYSTVFRYLGSKKQEAFSESVRLYYAAIRFKADPAISNGCFELTLNAGEWDDEKREYKTLSIVRVDWSDWSQARKNSLIREHEVVRSEAAKRFGVSKGEKGWVFFVGQQDADDPALFHVNHYRLICFLSAQISWPPRIPKMEVSRG